MPARRKTTKKAQPSKRLSRDIAGLMLIALGIFALISVFFTGMTGAFGQTVKDVLAGLFGVIAYAAPFLLIVIGWLVMISWKARIHTGKLGAAICALALLVVLVHLIYDNAIRLEFEAERGYGAYLAHVFTFGVNTGGGAGVLGGALAWPLDFLLGRAGAFVLVIAGLIGCIALLTRFSLGDAGRKVTEAAYSATASAIGQARGWRAKTREDAPEDGEENFTYAEPPRGRRVVTEPVNEPVESEERIDLMRDDPPPPQEKEAPVRREFAAASDARYVDETVSIPRRKLPNERIRKIKGNSRRPEPDIIDLGTGRRIPISAIRDELDEPQQQNAAPFQMEPMDSPGDDASTQERDDFFYGMPQGLPLDDVDGRTKEISGEIEYDEMGLPVHEAIEDEGISAPEGLPEIDELAPEPELELPVPNDKLTEAEDSALRRAAQTAHVQPGAPQIDLPPAPPPPPPYKRPQIDLLVRPENSEAAERRAKHEQEERAQLLLATLKSFGIDATVVGISRGPRLTRYELRPAAGIKVSRITSLSDDIAMNMAAAGVRIEAPIPGKAAIGIEVPNIETVSVVLREVLTSDEFQNHKSRLAISLGMDITGKPVVGDLADMPHLLIAGATGSGKSVCINALITSILYKSSPEDVKLIMIDPKVVELSIYNGIPHLLIPVVTDPKKAAGALNWAVQEMESRYKKFAATNCRDLKGYNEYARMHGLETIYQLVVIVDELADLMIVASREVEEHINRLAQLARAAGIHLVIATQRPSVNVITGVIKANIPSRIAFAVASQVDSRTILDMAGAEKLLGKGDMLYFPRGASKPRRVQCCLITDPEQNRVIDVIKRTNGEVLYNPDIIETLERLDAPAADAPPQEAEDGDDLLRQAIELALDAGQVSASMLQRRYRIGYARAGRLIDEMEQRGIISGHDGSKPREVLLTRDEFNRMYIQQ